MRLVVIDTRTGRAVVFARPVPTLPVRRVISFDIVAPVTGEEIEDVRRGRWDHLGDCCGKKETDAVV